MKRTLEVLVAIFVPFAGAFYASRWALRKFSEWRDDERRTLSPSWQRSFAERVSYEESQASVSEPMPWARPPRVSDGPVSNYTRRA